MENIEIIYTLNGFTLSQKKENKFVSRRELIDYMTFMMERHNFNSSMAIDTTTGELLALVEW